MYKKLKYSFLAIFALVTIAASILPVSPVAARVPCPDGTTGPEVPNCVPNEPLPPDFSACGEYVLTFPAWYRGLVTPPDCEVKITKITDFIKIPLNVLEILIQAVAYASVGYIIWGGFKYMKSQGDPGKISEAKTAIINALTGLGIALASVAIVEFIQGAIL